MLELMTGATSLERAVEDLVERANELGGHDNITLVAIAIS
jgi:serine/threonine protein phosphatase PrpC